jgi:hypothetical protein
LQAGRRHRRRGGALNYGAIAKAVAPHARKALGHFLKSKGHASIADAIDAVGSATGYGKRRHSRRRHHRRR